jgi:phosphate/sulfate permease
MNTYMKELTGPNQFLLLLTFIAVDLALNWLWITEKKKSPNHLLNWIVRAVVGAAIVYNGDTLTWFWRCVNLIPISLVGLGYI